jgi:carboxymethylenebutenolidase
MSTAPSRQNITFPIDGGHANGHNNGHGYLALPVGGQGPGVLVIQEWWGLTDQLAGVVDRLAAEGFVALAPDLYGGRVTHNAAEAQRWTRELPVERGVALLSGAVDHLLGSAAVTGDAIGAVGYCMGGGFVIALAAAAGAKIAAAVPYYGVFAGDSPDLAGLRAAVQGHFGDRDSAPSPEQVRRLAADLHSQPDSSVELHFYPAGHAFANEENRAGNYDPAHASVAWQRTLRFLREKIN